MAADNPLCACGTPKRTTRGLLVCDHCDGGCIAKDCRRCNLYNTVTNRRLNK